MSLSPDQDDNKQDILEGVAYRKKFDLVLYSDGLEEYKKRKLLFRIDEGYICH